MSERLPVQPEPEERLEAAPLEDALWRAVEQSPRIVGSPAIWVGTIEDYQAGSPHGRWINAARSQTAVEAEIAATLARSPYAVGGNTPAHWHMFSTDGFGDRLTPDTPLVEVVRLANQLKDAARGFAAWAQLNEGNRAHLMRFDAAYRGRYDSVHDWAVLFVEQAGYDTMLDERVPEDLRPHVEINVDSLAHELLASGAVVARPDRTRGGVYIFDLRGRQKSGRTAFPKRQGPLWNTHSPLNGFNEQHKIDAEKENLNVNQDQANRLAELLRERREKLQLSASEVARRAGVTAGTVTRIELSQIASPLPESLVSIADVLGIPRSDIFALMGWVSPGQLPTLRPYLRSTYRELPEAAVAEVEIIHR